MRAATGDGPGGRNLSQILRLCLFRPSAASSPFSNDPQRSADLRPIARRAIEDAVRANSARVRRQDRPHLGRRRRQGDRDAARPSELGRSAAFSPDGSCIVTASWDGTARIWDAATGEEIAVLRAMRTSWIPPPSAPTGCASSRRHWTGPPASGTPPPPARS